MSRLLHRILRGHYPEWEWYPISDFMSWKACVKCEEKK